MNYSTIPISKISVSTGGLFLLIGFFLATFILIRTTYQKKIDINFISKNLLLFITTSIILGRIGTFIDSGFLKEETNRTIGETIIPAIKYFFMIWQGGLSPLWVIIGFLTIFIIKAKKEKKPLLKWLDSFVLPGIIIIIFIHIGGFFSGWGYGKPITDENSPFQITYDLQDVIYSIPIHPVQLYGVTLFTILFIISVQIWKKYVKKEKWKDGTFFYIMVISSSIINFFLEFYRGDDAKMLKSFPLINKILHNITIINEMRITQILSFLIALTSIILLIILTTDKDNPSKT